MTVIVTRTCEAVDYNDYWSITDGYSTDLSTSNNYFNPTTFYIPETGIASASTMIRGSDYAVLSGVSAGIPEPCEYLFQIAPDSDTSSWSTTISTEIAITTDGDITLSPDSSKLYDSSDTFSIQVTASYSGSNTA